MPVMLKENSLSTPHHISIVEACSYAYADAAAARSLIRSFSQSNDWGLKYVTTRSWFLARAQPT